ncbi:MAG: hypothetical protein ACP5JW_06545 [Candidatus Bathyarchaeia archaeon]
MQKKPFNRLSALPPNQTYGLDRCLIKRPTKISMPSQQPKPSMGLRGFPGTKRCSGKWF